MKYPMITLGQQKSNPQISFERPVVCLLLPVFNSPISKSHDKDEPCNMCVRFWTGLHHGDRFFCFFERQGQF